MALFEGQVKEITSHTAGSGRPYVLVHVNGLDAPLAITKGYKGQLPAVGDRVSVEAERGSVYYFPGHRSLAITRQPVQYWNKKEKSRFIEEVKRVILDHLSNNPIICADDVFDPIRNICDRYKRDYRNSGAGFNALAKQGIIHLVGYTRTQRKGTHAATLAVWEMTWKK